MKKPDENVSRVIKNLAMSSKHQYDCLKAWFTEALDEQRGFTEAQSTNILINQGIGGSNMLKEILRHMDDAVKDDTEPSDN